ncbi:MAG: PIG-L family deacetylase [Verrucomicrobia bacterium]|nr:PIG-L family deacetylase [Verrucomicrobiota bacterium]
MLNLLPKPDGERPLRVLCLGAHSDDIEMGCGASLLQFVASGRPLDVRWVVFSGKHSRAQEAGKSARFWLDAIQSKTIDLRDYRDGFFPDEWSAIKETFEDIKATFEPDIVFTHFRDDLHQDHRIINQLTWNTFRNHFILEYEIPKYDGDMGSPNFFIPLPETAAKAKVSALMEYFGSQANKHWFCEELFLGLMRIRGMESCSPSGYAEGFYARKTCMGL